MLLYTVKDKITLTDLRGLACVIHWALNVIKAMVFHTALHLLKQFAGKMQRDEKKRTQFFKVYMGRKQLKQFKEKTTYQKLSFLI